jgi:hypothetical protein
MHDTIRIILLFVAIAIVGYGAIAKDVGVVAIGLGLLGVPGYSSVLDRKTNGHVAATWDAPPANLDDDEEWTK